MAVLRRRKGLDATAVAEELKMTLGTSERITAFRSDPAMDEQIVSLQDHLRLRHGSPQPPRAGQRANRCITPYLLILIIE